MSEKQQAESYLRQALGDPNAVFLDGQWESIEQLLNGERALVVQRCGWGKSMVYFLATKLLRDKGAGPTLLISPLLSLMRNQLETARKIGLKARRIDSSINLKERQKIDIELLQNQVDILLISPERLASEDFMKILGMVDNIGLIVIDEAHCISDWGHDFRPDYRRIVRVLQAMPPNVPVLATTATANNRVKEDIQQQLGKNLISQKGTLALKNVKLQNIHIPKQEDRKNWLAETIPTLPGTGIVYTLTQKDAENVASSLRSVRLKTKKSIAAEHYHGGMRNEQRESVEQQFLNNEIKVVVATVALGMGIDKPDVGFVIHYQRPASVVHYYQQVGRAGRAVEEAYGILLHGEEDSYIAEYFMNRAFPSPTYISKILSALRALSDSSPGLTINQLAKELRLSKLRVEQAIKIMAVDSPSPVIQHNKKWKATPEAVSYQIDPEYVERIKETRKRELQEIDKYTNHTGCLMAFLQKALDDDSNANDCGHCKNCNPD